ncbi:hypothetical protein GCM10014715_47620 [Streptomyces spiralis]|uniref:Acetyltransferase n=1 Tax=Streptomyces spiralis TaxID=66376 RepID=A0A919A3H9_9ACTN|nr:hypothetical protein GCM10014715_47620 [Streptomyces spiralis]
MPGNRRTPGRVAGHDAAMIAHLRRAPDPDFLDKPGFEQLGLHRISLEVYAFNPRARRVYEKVGFLAEGVLRDALLWEGERVDAAVMSILAPEWSQHRGRPETTGHMSA